MDLFMYGNMALFLVKKAIHGYLLYNPSPIWPSEGRPYAHNKHFSQFKMLSTPSEKVADKVNIIKRKSKLNQNCAH